MRPAPFNPALARALASPIMTAQNWVRGRVFPAERPLINLSQAAPVGPPPLALRQAMAAAALAEGEAHLYGPVPGDAPLRAEIAARWSALYRAEIAPEQVAVTSGCNEAFAAALLTLAGAGDEVILPTPWYFNHKMWLDMTGVRAVALATDEGGLPDLEKARALITPRTRAIVLVSPNNPTGAEYPAPLLEAFRALAADAGIALALDETYRDYLSRDGPPHQLFAAPEWDQTLIHLYSFSKAYRLTGHRVGALISSPARVAAVEKFLDTVTICPSRIGQVAALEGLRSQSAFVATERREFAARRAALVAEFETGIGGWRLLGAGAYFAWVSHPFKAPAEAVARRLVEDQSLLALPGGFFTPEGDPAGASRLRLAFANVDCDGIAEMARRLRAFDPTGAI
ncbi:MAG: aminotransferase [Paracoccaceae bacterium]